MIENFSENGIQMMITELKEQGYLESNVGKITVWKRALDRCGITEDEIPTREIRDAAYIIADIATGNVDSNGKKITYVKPEIKGEYEVILVGILRSISSFLGK